MYCISGCDELVNYPIYVSSNLVHRFSLSAWRFMVFSVHLVESYFKLLLLWWLFLQPMSRNVMDMVIDLDFQILILLIAINFYPHVSCNYCPY
jgi:hypothetical protein